MGLNRKDIIIKKLDSLSKSKFRSGLKLKERDRLYICEKGMNKIIEHTYYFVRNRLSLDNVVVDGKQTPMKGHPVFIAQHATATCCRKCMFKWHHIKENKKLSENEKDYVVNIILKWINKEMEDNNGK